MSDEEIKEQIQKKLEEMNSEQLDTIYRVIRAIRASRQ